MPPAGGAVPEGLAPATSAQEGVKLFIGRIPKEADVVMGSFVHQRVFVISVWRSC